MSDDSKLPLTLPGGALMPHMSARRRHEIADVVFEMLGGTERLHHESNRDSDAYWQFITKVWGRGLPRAVATEHSVNPESLEELLKKADRLESMQVIDGTASRVDEDNVTDVEPED